MSPAIILDGLQTEARNSNSNDIDKVSTYELCQIINREDATVAAAVKKCTPVIAQAIDDIEKRVRQGGRVIYVGAGTSGRLGVLDASEIPPTYSIQSEQFLALIAGGDVALRYAQEGAEDDIDAAERDLKSLNMDGRLDSLIGIAASGRTPYVLRCLSFAKSLGCVTIGIACCEPSAMIKEGNVDHMVSLVTGPEVVTGSTRMKAGTATKMALNMLSTGIMIKVGKTFGNMMIDLKSSNKKLEQRSKNIIRTICGQRSPVLDQDLDTLLTACGGSVKLAVATILLATTTEVAAKRLEDAHGVLADVISDSHNNISSLNGTVSESEEGYVLCVDGGGSKCGAVLLGKNGDIGEGEAGGCNVSNVGLEAAISSISLAIQRAVDSCPTTNRRSFQNMRFRKVWVGLAGYERPHIAACIDARLSKLFNLTLGEQLQVSSDIDLIATTVGNRNHVNSVIILLAGTGSIAVNFERQDGGFKRTGRLGGWGYLLGDDGSGYSIGREGIRAALEVADEINLQSKGKNFRDNLDALVPKIFEHFGLDCQAEPPIELLTRALSPKKDNGEPSEPTKRIAEVARVVLDISASSEMARSILEAGSRSLVGILATLVKHQKIDISRSPLILAGGLMQSEIYQGLVRKSLIASGFTFEAIQAVKQPALTGAQFLLQQL